MKTASASDKSGVDIDKYLLVLAADDIDVEDFIEGERDRGALLDFPSGRFERRCFFTNCFVSLFLS